MTWLTKTLTLDLLAITIDSLNRVFKAIEASPDPVNDNWPPAMEKTQEKPEPQQTEPAPAQATEPTPEDQAEQNAALRTKAQETLRNIALKEGTDWITGTLFPPLGVESLNDVPTDKLNELIQQAESHLKRG